MASLSVTAAEQSQYPPPCVRSEADPLRTVLVHLPGAELLAVPPRQASRALFAAPADPEAAASEHDELTQALRTHGVEVLYVRELAVELLADPVRAPHFLASAVPYTSEATQSTLLALAPGDAADALIAGMDGGLEPLPNLMFQRDPSAWIGSGAIVSRMATRVRWREAWLVEALYRHHPRFAAGSLWGDLIGLPARVEGGDVMHLGDGRLALSMGERSTAHGVRCVARALLAAGVVDEVLALNLPEPVGFHLDLVATMVDRDAVLVWRRARQAIRGTAWRWSDGRLEARPLDDAVAEMVPGGRVIEVPGEPQGRAWDHGTNVLALAPGVVLAYEDNEATNARLAREGIEVVTIPGATLAAGRGGPRCLTCPVLRG